MNLPKVLSGLVEAQNSFDSAAYANCFAETAVVFDEGKTHNGRTEIKEWIADANEKYKATMEAIGFEGHGNESILKAKTTGNFPGSPIVLNYHFEIEDGLIHSLKVTG